MSLAMKRDRLPTWLGARREPLAAAYVGVSESAFRIHIAPGLKSIRLTPRTVAWLRETWTLGWARAPAARQRPCRTAHGRRSKVRPAGLGRCNLLDKEAQPIRSDNQHPRITAVATP
jgi:hypothetical protein